MLPTDLLAVVLIIASLTTLIVLVRMSRAAEPAPEPRSRALAAIRVLTRRRYQEAASDVASRTGRRPVAGRSAKFERRSEPRGSRIRRRP